MHWNKTYDRMITGEIKNQIDAIWDVFHSGGITNPMSVLEQMTYLFFMKMLDDAQIKKEAEANILGVKVPNPTFKEGMWHNPETDKDVPYNSLRWSVFSNMEATAMFNTVRNDAFVFIKNLSGGKSSAYSRFMRDAVFLIQNPRTLTKIVDGVDGLDMNNRDAMGDVYEYILGKMAASGNNGQFRTPRHIIRMMVELMQPTLKDEICDPAMGSAGFIVESAKYIAETYKHDLLRKENAEAFKGKMFHGFDTDSTMLRIGAMNLMLHGVEEPDVAYRDSLSSSNNDTEKYTLCLANPPFAGNVDSEDINKSLLAISNTKKTELLFVSLFVRMLQVGGRCASIVPDGVLFRDAKAYINLRKEIVENHTLKAIISMPQGIFLPYSPVATAIMIFTKTGNGGTDKVWFYDMQADGFSLDQKRMEIDDNDIPDIKRRFINLENETTRTRKDKSFFVPIEEIRQNNYILSFNRYKEVERKSIKYESPEIIQRRIESLESEILAAIKEFRLKFILDEK